MVCCGIVVRERLYHKRFVESYVWTDLVVVAEGRQTVDLGEPPTTLLIPMVAHPAVCGTINKYIELFTLQAYQAQSIKLQTASTW